MLRSTPDETSVRRCIKSFTSCTSCLVDSLLNYIPDFLVNWLEVGLFGGQKNLEVNTSDRLDYCTFGMEAANDAQTVWVNTTCGKDHG